MYRRSLIAAALATPALAQAQASWSPDRPIRMVVPFAPGGSSDVTARLVAEAISARLDQPVVVENRPGAGGNIGSEAVARATPDGYTLLLGTSSTHATNAALYRNIPFNAQRDFAPVSQVAFIPNLLVISPDVPAQDLPALIALGKARPGSLNFGNAGSGTSQHLSAAMIAAKAGIEVTHVAYRGGAPAVTDLIGGKIQAMAAPLVEVIAHVQAGRLRAIAITTARRSALLPQVPTIAETIPGFEVALWNGIFAPAGTPAPVVLRVSNEIATVLRTDALRAKLAEQGSEPVGSNPEAFATFIAAEIPKWAELVRISGATVE
ncbi:tripartite tricarboxylate transporter substrate binding protein [Roseomonas terrae]|jgi:tripartite-type tricarboxylate transporter receptor subunit TctC|uniref:Tripartite tricarboxylate transporter substrate binding protein n=1 Tax=Neoroseomonas terrae TaxID=424799 RepID=A0ABS5ENT5_9PROT|nr:tripartite tricarboxylate transporter substrate binding protein [Neoroseomonas terrae]MBR0652686.1 tripartite tricarboxylate transporter substrate binding protein [Neoroseomonas terrae]